MKELDIKRAVIEARRFIDAAEKHMKAGTTPGKTSGALRRSSMDLTRSLAEMRGKTR